MRECRSPSGKHRWKEDRSRDLLRCLDCGLVETLEGGSKLNDFGELKIDAVKLHDAMKRVSETSVAASGSMESFVKNLIQVEDDWPGVKYSIDPFNGKTVYTPRPPEQPSTPVRQWTSEDALTLILEEIKHDPDPFAAAGKWLTRFTNGVTDITRNLDDE